MDTGQRSKASGSTVWLVYAQVFLVISQAYNIPEHPNVLFRKKQLVARRQGEGKRVGSEAGVQMPPGRAPHVSALRGPELPKPTVSPAPFTVLTRPMCTSHPDPEHKQK